MNIQKTNFLIDVFSILPDELECFIQAPSLENEIIQAMMMETEFDYYKLVSLNKTKKDDFINQEVTNSIGNYIQNIQIKHNGKLLFEGFDGFEYGTLSKHIVIPKWFKERYVPDFCTVSNEW